jgi:tellurite methyltransferase
MTADRQPDGTASAHRHWDDQWRTSAGRAGWLEPEPWVLRTTEMLRERGVRRVLDLGCGVGRHALTFARLGLETCALDRSEAGIAHLRRAVDGSGRRLDLRLGDFTALPYPAASFDYVLAWNVVYHGDPEVLATVLAEIRRVLRPDGWYQSTMLSKRNIEYGRGVEIAPGTYVRPDASDDKVHPHLFQNEHDVLRSHGGFSVWAMFDWEHGRPGSYHWHLLFQRKADPDSGT